MELDGTLLVALKAPKSYICKSQQQCLSPWNMSQLLKIIHRHCCEQCQVGTVFFPLSYTCQPYYQAEGKCASTHAQKVHNCDGAGCTHYFRSLALTKTIKWIHRSTGKSQHVKFGCLAELSLSEVCIVTGRVRHSRTGWTQSRVTVYHFTYLIINSLLTVHAPCGLSTF